MKFLPLEAFASFCNYILTLRRREGGREEISVLAKRACKGM